MCNWDIVTCSLLDFSQCGLDLEEFILDVIIPLLLPFCLTEFIDFGFQVGMWNLEFVGSNLRLI